MSIFELPTYFYVCLIAAMGFDLWRLQNSGEWTTKGIIATNSVIIPGFLIFAVIMIFTGPVLIIGSGTLVYAFVYFLLICAAVFVWGASTGLSVVFGTTQFVFACLVFLRAHFTGENVEYFMFVGVVFRFLFPIFDDYDFYLEVASGVIYAVAVFFQAMMWIWAQVMAAR